YQTFEKANLDIEIALFLAVKRFPDRRFFRHNIAVQVVTIPPLEVKQLNASNLQFFSEQNMYRGCPDFKFGVLSITILNQEFGG
ncbi:MAG TPA: hypothetical protein VM680_01070, partial [Verrucomicrobiae bacterium]|nr:hypothetical protein [Verrucomicrobiae bacterium]